MFSKLNEKTFMKQSEYKTIVMRKHCSVFVKTQDNVTYTAL